MTQQGFPLPPDPGISEWLNVFEWPEQPSIPDPQPLADGETYTSDYIAVSGWKNLILRFGVKGNPPGIGPAYLSIYFWSGWDRFMSSPFIIGDLKTFFVAEDVANNVDTGIIDLEIPIIFSCCYFWFSNIGDSTIYPSALVYCRGR